MLGARGELGFEADVVSDAAPLNHLVAAMLAAGGDAVHVLRDPTRGGVATTLNEIARQSGVAVVLDERAIPVRPPVVAACEMLGFDPLYVANEGKLLAFVAAEADSGGAGGHAGHALRRRGGGHRPRPGRAVRPRPLADGHRQHAGGRYAGRGDVAAHLLIEVGRTHAKDAKEAKSAKMTSSWRPLLLA